MRKYKNMYKHEGKWYTKEKRVAKVGEKVLITHSISKSFTDGEVLTVIRPLGGKDLVMSNEMILSDSQYVVLVPRINGMEITDTWYDEMTCMEQQHNFVIQERGAGKKAFMEQLQKAKEAQPVPFSKEYYVQADSIELDAMPEQMTQAEYDKLAANLESTIAEINKKYGSMYGSVPASYYNHTLAELKKRIVPEKRKWTEAEITEAKRYVADKMSSLNIKHQFICFYKDTTKPTESIAVLYERTTPSWGAVQDNNFEISTDVVRKAIAKCMPTDEQNDHIGKMVATKKLFNEELPAWIVGDKK